MGTWTKIVDKKVKFFTWVNLPKILPLSMPLKLAINMTFQPTISRTSAGLSNYTFGECHNNKTRSLKSHTYCVLELQWDAAIWGLIWAMSLFVSWKSLVASNTSLITSPWLSVASCSSSSCVMAAIGMHACLLNVKMPVGKILRNLASPKADAFSGS